MANITSPGDFTNPHATQAENDALKKVKLHKFTLDPLKVASYATVTATWDVTVPETGFEIVISLNGQEVGTVGTKTSKLATQRENFALAVVINDPPLPFASVIFEVSAGPGKCNRLPG